jgi:hypothetical protein
MISVNGCGVDDRAQVAVLPAAGDPAMSARARAGPGAAEHSHAGDGRESNRLIAVTVGSSVVMAPYVIIVPRVRRGRGGRRPAADRVEDRVDADGCDLADLGRQSGSVRSTASAPIPG